MFEAEFGEAFAKGGVGALDDMWAFLDWGFTPEDVTQHVELFVGDADDILDPEMSNRIAKRLPDCTDSHVARRRSLRRVRPMDGVPRRARLSFKLPRSVASVRPGSVPARLIPAGEYPRGRFMMLWAT